jgi:hypothetical protein
LSLNRPGTPLDPIHTLEDHRDTSAATTQADVFSPPNAGGPAELTACQGVGYARTVWYDFYPDRDGIVRLRSSGYDNVIAVFPFDAKTFAPDSAHSTCVHQSNSPAEELLLPVKAGVAYTGQIGAVNGVGGPLEFLFDYAPAKRPRLSADATLKAIGLSTGLRIVSLSVSAPKGATVRVRCRPGCAPQAKMARTVRFPTLKGKVLRRGAKLEILVTKPKTIGRLIRYTIRPGNFKKRTFCLEPGSLKPRTSCT